jgi:23S rRNA pseudouridine1911/1915/1917 synthase
VLFSDDQVMVIDKPAGLLAHPTGTRFAWSAVGLAKARWPGEPVDLVHRLDRDTSGVLMLTRDPDANRFLKAAIKEGRVHKEYEAITRGRVSWDTQRLTGPIGPADGVIRIQMAVRDDGLKARTDVSVIARSETLTHVRCLLHTGRTHQIRVHLDHAGFPLLGDRMYGVPPEVFLRTLEHGADREVVESAGAPRQALHARRVRFPHPSGGEVMVEAPLAADMQRWWGTPECLPHDHQPT